jgi:hypothetical protein
MNQQLNYEFTRVMPEVALIGTQISLCTILQRGSVGGEPITNAMGQVDLAQTDYTTILSNIPCMLAVLRPFRPDISATVRKADETDTINDKAIELNGYYPQILQQHLAVVDGVTYEIFAVEADSQKQVTRLAARTFTL